MGVTVKYALHLPFENTDSQKVYLRIRTEESGEYSITAGAQKKSGILLFRMFLRFEEGQEPDELIQAHTDIVRLDAGKYTDAVLEGIIVSNTKFRYWYIAQEKASEGTDGRSTAVMAAAFKFVEGMDKAATGYSEQNRVGNIVMAGLTYQQFQKMFVTSGSRVIREDMDEALADAGVTPQEGLVQWKLEDTPQDYTVIIQKLAKAQILKMMSQMASPVLIQLPFVYTGFPQGYPAIFCKQNDLFFGMVAGSTVAGDPDNGYQTSVAVNSIVSLRQAVKLSSLKMKDLWSQDGLSLGFAFVNPIAMYADSSNAFRFDWREVAWFDMPAFVRDKVSDGNSYITMERPLMTLNSGWKKAEFPGGFEEIFSFAEELTGTAFPLEQAYDIDYGTLPPGLQKAVDTFFKSSDSISELGKYIILRPSAFTDAVKRHYTQRVYAALQSARMQSILNDIRDGIILYRKFEEELVDLFYREQDVKFRADAILAWEKSVATTEALLEKERAGLVRGFNTLYSEIGLLHGDISVEWTWLWRYMPVCAGIREATEDVYDSFLTPLKIFSTEAGSSGVIYDDDPDRKTPGKVDYLARSDISSTNSVVSTLDRLRRFIKDIRDNIVPFRASVRASGRDVVKDREE